MMSGMGKEEENDEHKKTNIDVNDDEQACEHSRLRLMDEFEIWDDTMEKEK